MNNELRKRITGIQHNIEKQKDELQEILEIEQDKFDNMPEGLQDSEKGEKMQEGIDNLETSIGELESAVECLNEVLE